MKRILIYLFIAISVSCVNRTVEQETEDTYNRDKFFVVNYEEILSQKAVVKLSDIASDIEYVPLETNDSCLLRSTADYNFTEKYIFIRNVDHVLMFDMKGKLIRKIGRPGRGPGEIGIIRYLSVIDPDQQLVVQTNWARKLYYFNYNGEFLKSVKMPDVMKIRVLPDHRQLFYAKPAWGNEKHIFILQNPDGDTLSVVKNYFNWENKVGYTGTVSYHLFKPFYDCKGITSMKSMYNDTVYCIKGDSIVPEYFINLGKYKLPNELRSEVALGGFQSFKENAASYRFAVPFESGDRLFIASQGFSDMEESVHWNLIYDRRKESGELVCDEDGTAGKIFNDMDGGPDFWPRGAINDSIIYMSILPHTITGEKKLAEFESKQALHPDKKTSFLGMLDNLSENDNPVLMIVKLKK